MPMNHRQRHPRLRERGVELKAFFGRGTRARLDSLWCDIGKIRKELERLGERGVSSGKRGILMDCLREIFRGTRNTGAAVLEKIKPAQVEIVCYGIRCAGSGSSQCSEGSAGEFGTKRSDDRPGDVVLHGEDVPGVAIVAFAPQGESIGRVRELCAHPESPSGASDSSFNDGRHSKALGDLANVEVLPSSDCD